MLAKPSKSRSSFYHFKLGHYPVSIALDMFGYGVLSVLGQVVSFEIISSGIF